MTPDQARGIADTRGWHHDHTLTEARDTLASLDGSAQAMCDPKRVRDLDESLQWRAGIRRVAEQQRVAREHDDPIDDYPEDTFCMASRDPSADRDVVCGEYLPCAKHA
jgi:hypothetical protein